MKKLLFLFFIFITIIAKSQDTPPTDADFKLVSTYTLKYHQADSALWIYKGVYGWTKVAAFRNLKHSIDSLALAGYSKIYLDSVFVTKQDTLHNPLTQADTTWIITLYNFGTKIDTSTRAQANGVATLDENGKVPISQISFSGEVSYQGTWNATTNAPELPAAAAGNKGYYYVVEVAGTYETIFYTIQDWIISNGTIWQKVDNSNIISSVFGRTGSITATTGDYNTSQVTENTNLYFTDTRARAAISLTTTGSSGASTYTNGVLNVPNYSAGSVTSVGLVAPTGLTVSGSPVTGSGTIDLSLTSGYVIPTTVNVSTWNALVSFPGFGLTHTLAAYGDHTHGGSVPDMYEFEVVSDGTNTKVVPFTLQEKTAVFFNGAILPASFWSGITTTTITLLVPCKAKDYIKIYASGSGGGGGGGSMTYPSAGIALAGNNFWDNSITNNSANWNTSYTDRLKWDGGSTSLVAATGRTSLGLGTAAIAASTDFATAAQGTDQRMINVAPGALNNVLTSTGATWVSAPPSGSAGSLWYIDIYDNLSPTPTGTVDTYWEIDAYGNLTSKTI
jgi:hypothetical protein